MGKSKNIKGLRTVSCLEKITIYKLYSRRTFFLLNPFFHQSDSCRSEQTLLIVQRLIASLVFKSLKTQFCVIFERILSNLLLDLRASYLSIECWSWWNISRLCKKRFVWPIPSVLLQTKTQTLSAIHLLLALQTKCRQLQEYINNIIGGFVLGVYTISYSISFCFEKTQNSCVLSIFFLHLESCNLQALKRSFLIFLFWKQWLTFLFPFHCEMK